MKHTDKCMHNPDFDENCTCFPTVWVVCDKETHRVFKIFDNQEMAEDIVANEYGFYYFAEKVLGPID